MAATIASILLLAASVTPALGFCAAHTHLDTRSLERRAEGEAKFGYFGEKGPLNWAALDAANSACAAGTRQSPINMVEGAFTLVSAKDLALTIPDFPQGIEFENLVTTIEGITEGKGASLETGGLKFELKQFHFHHPSEHVDNSVSMPMEMHMVFQTEAQQIAVLGVYVDVHSGPAPIIIGGKGAAEARRRAVARAAAGAANITATTATPSVFLETLFSSVGEITQAGSKTTTKPLVMSELVDLVKAGNLQTYSGSLTTPPCSEGVMWMVSTQKLSISSETFNKARQLLGLNARFTQAAPGAPNILAFAQAKAA